MTTDIDGAIVFMSVAASGAIDSVWTTTSGDVADITAEAGNTIDASLADSSIPWKVATSGSPTTEGRAIWDLTDDLLLIGGSGTTFTVALVGNNVNFGSITLSNPLSVPSGGTGSVSFTSGGVLLGSGTGSIKAMSVLNLGEIIVGDGTTDPVPLAAFTSSTDFLKHENGGIEFNASAVVDSDFIVGTGAGTMGLESGNTARTSLGLGTGDSPTFTGLTTATHTFDFSTQDYLITNRDNQFLSIQGQLAGSGSNLGIFSNDGDTTDNVTVSIWGRGTPGVAGDFENLTLGWNTGSSTFDIFTDFVAAPFGVARDLRLYASMPNIGQLNLSTNGDVSMNGSLTVTSLITGGSLTINNNVTFTSDTTNIRYGNAGVLDSLLFTGNGTAANLITFGNAAASNTLLLALTPTAAGWTTDNDLSFVSNNEDIAFTASAATKDITLTSPEIILTASTGVGIGTTSPDNDLQVVGSSTFGDDAGNEVFIENDGTLNFLGNATVWDDLRVPLSAIRITGPGGTTPPDEVLYKGSAILAFGGSGTDDEIAYFSAQLPHSYKEGTNITPHVHWTPEDNGAGNVRWVLTYSWANINATYPAESTDTIVVACDTTTDKHQVDSFSAITGTGKTISSMLLCSIQREDSDGTDTYNNKDAYLAEIDFHFELDTVGSRAITSK